LEISDLSDATLADWTKRLRAFGLTENHLNSLANAARTFRRFRDGGR
jgi:hypothetical protein